MTPLIPPERTNMTCLNCGSALEESRANMCPDCGKEFDPDDPRTFKRVLNDPVRIFRGEIAEVISACLMLEQHGIPARIEREAGGVIAHFDIAKGTLWVERDDEDDAKVTLKATVSLKQAQRATPEAKWTCPSCNETVEPQFEVCWNCQTEKPE